VLHPDNRYVFLTGPVDEAADVGDDIVTLVCAPDDAVLYVDDEEGGVRSVLQLWSRSPLTHACVGRARRTLRQQVPISPERHLVDVREAQLYCGHSAVTLADVVAVSDRSPKVSYGRSIVIGMDVRRGLPDGLVSDGAGSGVGGVAGHDRPGGGGGGGSA
jgi:hypothetical protein